MRAKMYTCNFLCCVMAIMGSYAFIQAFWSENLLANIYIGSLSTIASVTYHFIGKHAVH